MKRLLYLIALMLVALPASAQITVFSNKTDPSRLSTITFTENHAANTITDGIGTCSNMEIIWDRGSAAVVEVYATTTDDDTYAEVAAATLLTTLTTSTTAPVTINPGTQQLRLLVTTAESASNTSVAEIRCSNVISSPGGEEGTLAEMTAYAAAGSAELGQTWVRNDAPDLNIDCSSAVVGVEANDVLCMYTGSGWTEAGLAGGTDNLGNHTVTTALITGVGTNGNIVISPDGTGDITLGGAGTGDINLDETTIMGATLDMNNNAITTTFTNGDVTLTPNGTGDVEVGGTLWSVVAGDVVAQSFSGDGSGLTSLDGSQITGINPATATNAEIWYADDYASASGPCAGTSCTGGIVEALAACATGGGGIAWIPNGTTTIDASDASLPAGPLWTLPTVDNGNQNITICHLKGYGDSIYAKPADLESSSTIHITNFKDLATFNDGDTSGPDFRAVMHIEGSDAILEDFSLVVTSVPDAVTHTPDDTGDGVGTGSFSTGVLIASGYGAAVLGEANVGGVTFRNVSVKGDGLGGGGVGVLQYASLKANFFGGEYAGWDTGIRMAKEPTGGGATGNQNNAVGFFGTKIRENVVGLLVNESTDFSTHGITNEGNTTGIQHASTSLAVHSDFGSHFENNSSGANLIIDSVGASFVGVGTRFGGLVGVGNDIIRSTVQDGSGSVNGPDLCVGCYVRHGFDYASGSEIVNFNPRWVEDGTGGHSAATFPGAGAVTNAGTDTITTTEILDDTVALADMAGGTDGNLITYDASGDPAFVATGTATQVLTSNGAGAAPTFQNAAGGGDITTDDAWVAAGDLIVGTGTDTASVLSLGSDTNVLTVSGGTAAWAAAPAGGTVDGITGDTGAATDSATPKIVGGTNASTISEATTDTITVNVPSASTSVVGAVELAIGSEVNTGTSTTLAVTPDALDDWTGSAQFTTAGVLTATSYGGITEANLVDKSATEAIAGDWDFGGGGIEIPNGDTPTVNATGEIAFDTTITDWQGGITYFDGAAERTVVSIPAADLVTPTDNFILKYNATTDDWEFEADVGGGTVTASGSPLVNQIATFTTATDIDSTAGFEWDGTTMTAPDVDIDNININLNTISSTAGTDLNITPLAGQQIVLDGTIVVDAGVVTGATSITSTDVQGTTATFSGAVDTGAHTATSYTADPSDTAEMRMTSATGADEISIGLTDNGTTTTADFTVDDGTGDDVKYFELDGATALVEIHDVFDFQKDGVLVHTATIDDDVCDTAGEWWYDTTDTAFEFCEAASGAPTVLGGGSYTFNIDGDNASPQAVADTETATVAGTAPISTSAAATRTVTVSLDNDGVNATHIDETAVYAWTGASSHDNVTSLDVDNINVNLNTISSTAGTDLNITPLAGQQLVLDGTVVLDAGVITGATSVTSTAFVGDLTGNADTVTTNANLTGHVTSTGNATVLGAFTSAQLVGALSDEGAATTVMQADGTWVANSGSGTVTSATQAENQVAIWTATTDELEGDADFTYNGSVLQLGTADTLNIDSNQLSTSGLILQGSDTVTINSNEVLNDRGAIGTTFKATARSADTPIAADQAVFITDWPVEGCVEVGLADADGVNTMPAVGISGSTITDGDCLGDVVTSGTMVGQFGTPVINEDYFVGTTAGAIVTTAPTGETALIQKLAVGIDEAGTSDRVHVFGAGRANAVPNLDDAAIFLGNASNQAAAVDLTGDMTLDNTGDTTVTAFTIDDVESTNDEFAVVFEDSGSLVGGASLGPATDGDLTYNPSSGTLTATAFAGDISAATGSIDLGTGTVGGAVPTEFATAATIGSPPIGEFVGKWFFITSGTGTITLPEITASGQSACFYSVTAINVTLDLDATDIFVLPGVADLAAGNTIDSGDTKGEFVCVISQEVGGADKWFVLGQSGTWTDGGAT